MQIEIQTHMYFTQIQKFEEMLIAKKRRGLSNSIPSPLPPQTRQPKYKYNYTAKTQNFHFLLHCNLQAGTVGLTETERDIICRFKHFVQNWHEERNDKLWDQIP